jgi:hypothetical protein
VNAPEPVHVALDIERIDGTISGRLAFGGTRVVRFYGWLELIDRIERALAPHGQPAGASERPGQGPYKP